MAAALCVLQGFSKEEPRALLAKQTKKEGGTVFHRVVRVGKDGVDVDEVGPGKSSISIPEGTVAEIVSLETLVSASQGRRRLDPDRLYLVAGRNTLKAMSVAVSLVRKGVCTRVGFTSSATGLCYLVIPFLTTRF